MARPTVDFDVDLKIMFTEISEDEVTAWRAGVSLLLQWLKETKNLLEANDGRGLYAWVIGHGGSVQRMALAEWRVRPFGGRVW